MKRVLVYILALMAASSCIYPYTQELETPENPIVVIEGDILSGGTTVVKLSYMKNLNTSSKYKSVSFPSGKAWVEDENGGVYQMNGFEVGTEAYSLIIPTDAIPEGLKVRLVVIADGETYSSEWLESRKPPVIESVSFSADEADVHVAATISEGENSTGYLAVTYDETWEFHADWGCLYEFNMASGDVEPLMSGYPYYYCWKSASTTDYTLIDCTETGGGGVTDYPVLTFSRFNNRNHKRYSINVHARTLSEEEYRYRKTLADNSDIGGDLFSPNPGEIGGNLSCESTPGTRVLGYVTACQVVSKRVYLSSQYLLPRITNYDFVIPADEDERWSYYNKGWRPVDMMSVDGEVGVAWGPLRCINCIEAGGTQTRPDFWED